MEKPYRTPRSREELDRIFYRDPNFHGEFNASYSRYFFEFLLPLVNDFQDIQDQHHVP